MTPVARGLHTRIIEEVCFLKGKSLSFDEAAAILRVIERLQEVVQEAVEIDAYQVS